MPNGLGYSCYGSACLELAILAHALHKLLQQFPGAGDTCETKTGPTAIATTRDQGSLQGCNNLGKVLLSVGKLKHNCLAHLDERVVMLIGNTTCPVPMELGAKLIDLR